VQIVCRASVRSGQARVRVELPRERVEALPVYEYPVPEPI